MDEEVYIKLPKISVDDLVKVRRFFRALYGHPKAGQLWNSKFVRFMKNQGQYEINVSFFSLRKLSWWFYMLMTY